VVYVNPFTPVRLDVHPLTRVMRDASTGARSIEAHVELFDAYNQPVKALGTFVFELYEEGVGEGGGRTQIQRWKVDKTLDPAQNARAFDRVTRTYSIRLTEAASAAGPGRRLSLRVQFTPTGGTPVSSDHRF
jgi:hypothetical protein